MLRRLGFILIALFWLCMNGLLWRAEFGAGHASGGTVPVSLVWRKMLTAPDVSTLEITHHQQRLGFCRWIPKIGEPSPTAKTAGEELSLEGRIRHPTGYTLEVEGNLSFLLTNRLRFSLQITFGTNRVWQTLHLNLNRRPGTWDVQANAAAQSLQIQFDSPTSQWERTLTFEELRQPARWLPEFGLPWEALLGNNSLRGSLPRIDLGLQWQAREDWIKIGHAQVRIYRLEAHLLDRYQAVVLISRAGEILRVELPDDLRLVNEALTL